MSSSSPDWWRLELIDRERRLVERRIKQAGFPVVKQLESFDFKAIPAVSTRCWCWISRAAITSTAGRM